MILLNIETFGGYPDGSDTTIAVRRALEAARTTNADRLFFPKGEYHFWPDRAEERYLFVSNNDASLKRLVFVLDELDWFEIDGQGSLFIFHGFLTPFLLNASDNIRLTGFAIDWAQPFHCEAQILAVEGNEVDLHIPIAFPYHIEHERLGFMGDDGATSSIYNALEFDEKRRETAFRVTDNYSIRRWHRAIETGPRQVRLEANWRTVPTPGNRLAMPIWGRLCPAIVVDRCCGICIEDVTLHHAGGMGILAQCSADLSLRGVRVSAREGSGRLVSLTADATHFVCCEGKIILEDCLFESQLDDATNVHGIYQQITQILSAREVEVCLVHSQQKGLDIIGPGDLLDFVDNQTLNVYSQRRIASVERTNRSFFRVRLDQELCADVQVGHAILNTRWNPDVSISHCMARGNRARGFLVSTAGEVRIESNTFHTPGSAILIAGDANYWFESGPTRNVTIRRNTFDNCNFGVWGRATIDIHPEIEPCRRDDTVYHAGIHIEDNVFCAFDHRLLAAHGVQGLVFVNNRLEPTYDYPRRAEGTEPFVVAGCPDAVLEIPFIALPSMVGSGDETEFEHSGMSSKAASSTI